MSAKSATALAFCFVLLAALPVRAEHEVHYRYTVLGYVNDADGRPQRGARLELTREKTGFTYLGETDEAGLYVIVARLGDESAGERLRLRLGTRTVPISARFDPGDHATERGTRVDFLGGRPTERPEAFAGTLRRFLAR